MIESFSQKYLDSGVVAIMRANSSDQLLAAAEAILAGGVNAIEVTFTTPGALQVITDAVDRFGSEVAFGAGTVLDAETARTAILAGAQFIVAPSLDLDTVALCRRYSVPVMPGVFTPTEVVAGWQAGADYVKVFPAGVGGPDYIKALKAPLPQVRMVGVGGVNLSNVADFVRAGVDAVGIGGDLVNQSLLAEAAFSTITERAIQFREQVALGRQG